MAAISGYGDDENLGSDFSWDMCCALNCVNNSRNSSNLFCINGSVIGEGAKEEVQAVEQQQPGNDQALFPTSLSIWDDPEDMEPFTSMGMECIPSGSDAEFLCGLA